MTVKYVVEISIKRYETIEPKPDSSYRSTTSTAHLVPVRTDTEITKIIQASHTLEDAKKVAKGLLDLVSWNE